MALDAQSRKRLEELGRRLPEPLPPPPAPAETPAQRARQPRHAVETETDPEKLFQHLMQASADGTVPPHLLARLRDVEQRRRSKPASDPGAQAPKASLTQRRQRSDAQDPLYVTFEQLLLEDDEA